MGTFCRAPNGRTTLSIGARTIAENPPNGGLGASTARTLLRLESIGPLAESQGPLDVVDVAILVPTEQRLLGESQMGILQPT